jgi:PKD repeat protein
MKNKIITTIFMMFLLENMLVITFNPAPTSGHIGDVLTAWAITPPTIDGMISPANEWDDAAQVSVFTGSYAGSIFYVMNDEDNMYLALSVVDSTFTPNDIVSVRFDNDHNGLLSHFDDKLYPTTTGFRDSYYNSAFGWLSDPYQVDGSSAAGILEGANFFEISHPLNSGDPYDFSLSEGDIVGFCLSYFNDGLCTGESVYPHQDSRLKDNQQYLYSDIMVAYSVEDPVELCYDDGDKEGGVSSDPGYQFAVRFSVPIGWTNAKILTARYYISWNPGTFKVHVRDSDGDEGLPGTDLISSFSVTPTAYNEWFDVDLSGYNLIVTGDFYIVMEEGAYMTPILGYDRDVPIDLRSYCRHPNWPPGEWHLFDDKDLMIRAVIETYPPVNEAPVAEAGVDQTIILGETAEFDGSDSYDPDGVIVSYEWDFGDGHTGSGVTTTHEYGAAGDYTVTLTVTDDDDASSSDTSTMHVNALPVAEAGPDQTVNFAETVVFDGSDSYDPDGVIVSYEWDFGDDDTGSGVTTSHEYGAAGDYTVTLTVTDDDDASSSDTTTVHVRTPEERTQKLVETIDTYDVSLGTKKSLKSKLEEAIHLLNPGNEIGAIHKLMDFISFVEAIKDKKLILEQANYLVAEAQGIINQIQK